MADILTNPVQILEDAGVGGLGIWFIEYLIAPSNIIALWPNEMSRRMAEGALSVLLWQWMKGTGASWESLGIQAVVGGVLGYYLVYAVKGN